MLGTSFDDLPVPRFSGVKSQINDVPEPAMSENEPVESDLSETDLPTKRNRNY